MATVEAVRQQVLGILSGNNVPVEIQSEGEFLVPGPAENSSVLVIIEVKSAPTGETFVQFISPVVMEIAEDEETQFKAIALANQLNNDVIFSRFVFEDGGERRDLVLHHELHGDDLQESELMRTLVIFATQADNADELIQEFLGSGVRAIEDAESAEA